MATVIQKIESVLADHGLMDKYDGPEREELAPYKERMFDEIFDAITQGDDPDPLVPGEHDIVLDLVISARLKTEAEEGESGTKCANALFDHVKSAVQFAVRYRLQGDGVEIIKVDDEADLIDVELQDCHVL